MVELLGLEENDDDDDYDDVVIVESQRAAKENSHKENQPAIYRHRKNMMGNNFST